MNSIAKRVLLAIALLSVATVAPVARAEGVRNFIFFNLDRGRIREAAFLNNPGAAGAQLKYTWRELEPARDRYDFSPIRKDLAFLISRHKALFVQLQDVTFSPQAKFVPNYLLTDASFHGGVDKQYAIEGDDESKAVLGGWVARRWDPAVQERFRKLFKALGSEFDGKIEGINLPETAVEFGTSGHLYPTGYSPAAYREAVLANMAALKRAFTKSVTIQYANFMPGEWLPDQDEGYLRSVYEKAKELKVGVGGPDLLPYRPGQLHHSYPLIRRSHGAIPTAIAVQEGNYSAKNPKTSQRPTIAQLYAFARDELKVSYIFWCTEEPYYSREVLPFLVKQAGSGSRSTSDSHD